MAIIQHAVLPHTWVSKAITSALQDRALDALFYLVVTCANALFASVLVIGIVSGRFVPAFARAQVSGAGKLRRSGKIIALIAETLFAYLPKQQRLLAVKDTRSFCRDPLQWSQMAILFGLLVLYVSNIHRIWVDISDPRLPVLIGFLNMTAVSLILATFTSRFVFPLVSLEGQQIWLLGLLPLARSRMIIAKFLYALTITIVAAVGVISVSAYRLQLSADLVTAHLVCIITICVGLCGVSIGMGARLPMFKERNPARIAGGFGGTIGLLVCVALVVVSLAGLGMMSFEMVQRGYGNQFTTRMVIWLVLIGAVNMATAAIALFIGIRHFNRLEF
jgi:ABC-2 type transport system permease protein